MAIWIQARSVGVQRGASPVRVNGLLSLHPFDGNIKPFVLFFLCVFFFRFSGVKWAIYHQLPPFPLEK